VQDDDPEDDPASRADRGSLVAFSNMYFTCSHISQDSNSLVRMRVQPKWACEEYMGKEQQSKHVGVASYGSIERTYIVLRAWMLHRARNFCEGTAARKAWFRTELLKLATEISTLAVPGGGTGSPAANAQILEWVPEIRDHADGF